MRPGRAAQEGQGFGVPTAGSAGTAVFHPAGPRSHPPPTVRLSPYSPFEQFLTGVTVTRGDRAEPLWLQPPGVFPIMLRSLTASEVRMLEVLGQLAQEVLRRVREPQAGVAGQATVRAREYGGNGCWPAPRGRVNGDLGRLCLSILKHLQ